MSQLSIQLATDWSLTTSNKSSASSSTKNFLSALVANGALLGVEVLVFVVLRQRARRIYSPRTFLPPPEKRSAELPKGSWRWLPAVLEAPSEDIIKKNGLDAYMFLRFLKMLIRIFLVFTILTFAVIVPVDYAGMHGARSGLERITWTNINDPKAQPRFIAHVVVVYILTFYVLYQIYTELIHFTRRRHAYLLRPSISLSPPTNNTTTAFSSSDLHPRTVLITSVPVSLASEDAMKRFADGFVPGGVERVWVYRDTRVLNKLVEERERACNAMEKAIGEVVGKGWWRWKEMKRRERWSRSRLGEGVDIERRAEEGVGEENDRLIDSDTTEDVNALELLDELVPRDKRPKWRAGPTPWGLVGRKVDAIEWFKTEIPRLNEAISEARVQALAGEGKFQGSVFVLCKTEIGANVLAQCVDYHEPLKMTDKYLNIHPSDIVWRNLDYSALETRWKKPISWAATVSLILVWGVPVALVGGLSNVGKLCRRSGEEGEAVDWEWILGWVVCEAPEPIPSIIQGILPPVLLAVLFMILPKILRALAWYECIPRHSLISMSVYRRFFLFQLIHGFFVVTLSSGLTSAIMEIIDNPTHMVQKLAVQLPGASVFFLTYMVTKGFSGAGKTLSRLMPLVTHYLKDIKWFIGRDTPREVYAVKFSMPSADFGVVLPMLSLLATIGFAYSVLNPLINVLAFLCFVMYYIAWKFLFSQVFDQNPARETGGMYFPMAVSNLFVGLYIEQICLTCLFFMKTGVAESRKAALVQGVLMLVLLGCTVGAHVLVKKSFSSITRYLPMSLATDSENLSEMQIEEREQVDLDQENSIEQARDESPEEHPDFDSDTALTPNVPVAKIDTDASNGNAAKSQLSIDEHTFDPPSMYVEQQCIWIPRDKLGLSKVLIEELRAAGVEASDEGAVLEEDGRIDVFEGPPASKKS